MKFYRFLTFFLILVSFFSCKEENEIVDVSNIAIDLKINRFDIDYHNATLDNFTALKEKYPKFFPEQKTDSLWLSYAQDSLWVALYEEVENKYSSFDNQKKELTDVFKHIKYYYPTFKTPRVVTFISSLDMEYQVINTNGILILSLDTFLGNDSKFYANYPAYLRTSFDENQIPTQVARTIAKETQPKVPHRVFINRMIAAGQLQYAVSKFSPSQTEANLFRYSTKKMKWLQESEEEIWKYLVEKEYLYSTDKDLARRFLEPAPFTKFYMAYDNESPGRVGEWMGYQIVKAYMKNNEVSLPEMMATTPTQIFKKSKYKPTR